MVREGEQMLLISQFGFGKRTEYDNFSAHGRGTRGQICYKATEKTGEVVAVLSVNDKDDLVCITSQGNTVKVRLAEIAMLGKTAMGVRIVNITKPDVLVGIARVVKDDSAEAPADVPAEAIAEEITEVVAESAAEDTGEDTDEDTQE